ncbi:vacuolar protein sorting-associated protein 33A-like [Xenia sp. Carnegie-2017]|uniref:vacuolar protein sorting-associated protein 33A-like n=1 Tax=Xenia sp. Carnegie-2017 TaxID=2897299 RepID=UPI001F048E32|nr:vacuolar protein sorting-associated protein 33A-like [Xenia sp. Carnegie-2017]
MAAHLSRGRINVGLIREAARRELLNCLDKCPGSKALVWDNQLTGPFGLIAEYSLLKEHEVDAMFQLQAGQLPKTVQHCKHIFFITRAKVSHMEMIADNVFAEENRTSKKEYTILFVPRKTLLCEKRLQGLGVSFITLDEYPLNLVPFDNDLLSLEMDGAFKECYLENDTSVLYHVTNSLMTIQALYGIIPKIYGKGELAKRIVEMMLRKRREVMENENQITPQIDCLILMDRNVDLLTPLCTQLTYEGLIDEVYGIQNTSVKLPPEKFEVPDDKKAGLTKPAQPAGPKNIKLNSSDQLFAEIRDVNFLAVGPVLSRKAKQISLAFEEHRGAKTVSEMKQFVSKLPNIQAEKHSLANHTSIAELIKEHTDTEAFRENLQIQHEFISGVDTDKVNSYVEKLIALKEPLLKVLRILCIQSLTNNGFKPKVLEYYMRELVQTYGPDLFYRVFTPLDNAGFLRIQGAKHFPILRKSLNLDVKDVHEQNPRDIAYTYSGYAPLSVRLAQYASRPSGWRGIEEVLKLVPGPTIDEIQHLPQGLKRAASLNESIESADGPPKLTLIYFIGGCTYAEVAALRFLSQQDNVQTDYLIATTKMINGNSLLESIVEPEYVSSNPFL